MSRLYDIAVFRPRFPLPSLPSVGRTNAALVGIQKLSQRYLIELLTADGSVAYQNRGTGFWPAIRNGSLRTESDVFAAFLAARALLAERLRPQEGDPADESYQDSELVSVTLIGRGAVSLRIRLTSAAGENLQITLPITSPEYRRPEGDRS